MNHVPGFYWVRQHKGDQQLTIARLGKSSGWEFLASKHSHKMGGAWSPSEVIAKIELPVIMNCSFCGKPQIEAKILVAGIGTDNLICDECALAAASLVKEKLKQ